MARRAGFSVEQLRPTEQWASSFRKGFPWLRIAWELTTLLGLIAAGTIVVYLIVHVRNRRQRRRWLAEERMWTVVGDEELDEYAPEGEEDEEGWRS